MRHLTIWIFYTLIRNKILISSAPYVLVEIFLLRLHVEHRWFHLFCHLHGTEIHRSERLTLQRFIH